jgi:ureidoacrylate peracid hydrolase
MSAQAAIASTALLLLDLQNDFLHPDGAYGRAGQTAPEIAALPARLRPLWISCARAADGSCLPTSRSLRRGAGR